MAPKKGKGDAAALREEVGNLKDELDHCKSLITTLTEENDGLKLTQAED